MKSKTALVLSLAAAWCSGAFAVSGDSWPMYQGGAQHSGYVPQVLVPALAAQRWAVQAQAFDPFGLAIADGYVFTTPYSYFATETPLVAQKLESGQVAWSVDFGAIFSINQPAIDRGRIYLQTSSNSGDTYLHCYRTDGTFEWRSSFESQWERYLGPIVVDGNVYFDGGTYGGMYSFNGRDGDFQWYTGLPQYDEWSPTWAAGKLLAYTNQLDIIDPASGQSLGSIQDPDYFWSGYSPDQSAVVIGDLAYVTNGGRLIAFDLQNLTIAWTRSISATGQVATDGQQVFVISGGALNVRDPATGDLLWAWVPSASGAVTTNLIVTRSHVIAGDDTNTYLVNRTTHQVDHVFPATGMLAYGSDTLIVAASGGLVYAFNLPTDALFADDFE